MEGVLPRIQSDRDAGHKPKRRPKSMRATTQMGTQPPCREPGVGRAQSSRCARPARRVRARRPAARRREAQVGGSRPRSCVRRPAGGRRAESGCRRQEEIRGPLRRGVSPPSPWGSSLLSFGQAATNHANKLRASDRVQHRQQHGAWHCDERLQQHLQGSGTKGRGPRRGRRRGRTRAGDTPETAAEKEAEEEERSVARICAGYKVSPTSDRVDRDEGFDEVVSKEGSRRFWEEKDAAASPRATDSPPKVKDSCRAKAE